jgi:hypothetical protein
MKVTSVSKFRDWWTPNTDLQYTNVRCPWARFAGCSYRRHIRFAGFTVYTTYIQKQQHTIQGQILVTENYDGGNSIIQKGTGDRKIHRLHR